MAEMMKRERVMAAVRGEPVDRVPISFFQHNHLAERSADTCAQHLMRQNREFDWDFTKVHLRASIYGEAWGSIYAWNPEKGPVIENPAVKSVADLLKLKSLEPTKGVLAEAIKVARLLGEALEGSVPYIQTMFTPLAVVKQLTGTGVGTPSEPAIIRQFMEAAPEALHHALLVISQTMADYAREVIRAGADGIFVSTSVWSGDTISEEEYKIFGLPYDLPVYQAAAQEGATFNFLHLCRENIMLNLLPDYPIQVLSYDALSPRNPSLSEVILQTDKALWGGLSHKTSVPDTLLNGPIEAIAAEVHTVLEHTKGRRFLLGPGCSISPKVPKAHLMAAKEAIFTWQQS